MRFKKKSIVFLALIFIPITEAYGRVLQQSFEDSAAGFAITMPSGWRMAPRSTLPGPVRVAIRYVTPVDQFTPNVTIRVNPLIKRQARLEDFVQSERKALGNKLRILEEKNIVSDPGYWPAGYQWQLEDPNLRIIFLQRFFVLEGKSYILTAAAKKSTWRRFAGDFEQIFYSFQLKNIPREANKPSSINKP